MPLPKFNFIPEKQLGSDYEATFNVSLTKAGMIYFSPQNVMIYDMDGAFIKLYGDTEKKAIAWKIIKGSTSLTDLDSARKMSAHGKIKSIVVSVKKILSKLGIKNVEAKKYEVKTYESSLLEDKLYYIELN
jgi:hypothetical protein